MEHTGSNSLVQRLGIRYPIVQGPFGGGLSTVELASAVSNLGGLGSYGAHHMTPDQIGSLGDEIRARTDKPFAINLWVSDHDAGGRDITQQQFDDYYKLFEPYYLELGVAKPAYPQHFHHRFEQQVEALLEARPPVFSFVFGIPDPAVIHACKQRDIITVGTATSIAEAVALEAAGIDAIVATGFEAGGHRTSFLTRAEDSLMGTFALTQLVSRRVKIPVIAAGGIADANGVQAALMLGAHGAQIGSAFLACEESGASAEHRALLFSERAQHTALTRAFTGRLARGIRNRWVDEFEHRVNTLAPFPIQSWFMSQLKHAAAEAGNSELVALWGGQIAPNLQQRSAKLLMQSLVSGLEDFG